MQPRTFAAACNAFTARASPQLGKLHWRSRYACAPALFARKRTHKNATSGAAKTRCLRSGGLLRARPAARRGRRSSGGSAVPVTMVAPALFAARTHVRARSSAFTPNSGARATSAPLAAARGAHAARMRHALLRCCSHAVGVAPPRVVNSAARRAATPAAAALAVGEVVSDPDAEAEESAESSAALVADVLAGLTVTFITLPQARLAALLRCVPAAR